MNRPCPRRRPWPVALALVLLPFSAPADERPLWEAGAGLAAVSVLDYRGSDERQFYALPVPYFVYRGERLKVDRQSVRGLLFQSERAELAVSANAAPPVDSEDNAARAGMPDLDPIFELGPSLKLKLGNDRGARTRLLLPVRAVIATDFRHARQAGYVFTPTLNVDFPRTGGRGNVGVSAGLVFASRENNAYFYGVTPAHATPARPAYEARAGYAGVQFTLSANRRLGRLWLGGFARLDGVHGAAFEDSPLVRRKTNWLAGFAVSWVFAQSETVVEDDGVED